MAVRLHIDEGFRRAIEAELPIDVRDQVGQRLVDTVQVLARKAAFHVFIRAHAEEHGIVLIEQRLKGDVPAHLGVEHELDTHARHQLATRLDHFLFELEWWNAERQQSSDARIAIEHHGLDAVARQDVRAREARGTRADDGDALARGPHV
jgi:hypothetical protein